VSAATELRPLELRLAPEYRRSALYAAVGFVLLTALVVWKRGVNVNNGPWVNTVIGLAVFGTATLFLLAVVFRYRIRIDEHGVWRRRFVRWDLWPWEAFEQGLVRHGKLGDQLTYPARSWYWRTISASLLGDANRAVYEAVVARYRVPPPPPDLPETLTLKLPILATLELTADGIRVTGHRNYSDKLISWKEVVKADVLRASHDRPDFVTLELHLPGQAKPVRLTNQYGTANGGVDPEVICLYLRERLADNRFQVTTLRGPPADDAEADRRLALFAEAEQKLRKAHRINWYLHGVGALFLSVLIAGPWNPPNPMDWVRAAAICVLMGLHGLLGTVLVYFRGRDLRRRREEVVRWRARRGTG
jgi:hypothetical protein